MSVRRTTVKSAAKPKPRNRKERAATTDWQRLRRMSDAQALRGAARDPDNQPADATWLAAGHLVEPAKKQAISLRLDPDVVDWFRNTGARYQSRMNAVLRAFVEHQRQREASRTKRKRGHDDPYSRT